MLHGVICSTATVWKINMVSLKQNDLWYKDLYFSNFCACNPLSPFLVYLILLWDFVKIIAILGCYLWFIICIRGKWNLKMWG